MTYEYLTRKDVLQTIGVSAVMGVNGVVLWGDYPSVQNKTMCLRAKENLSHSLGPIILMLSEFLEDCSKTICHSRGRCILRDAFIKADAPNWGQILSQVNSNIWY